MISSDIWKLNYFNSWPWYASWTCILSISFKDIFQGAFYDLFALSICFLYLNLIFVFKIEEDNKNVFFRICGIEKLYLLFSFVSFVIYRCFFLEISTFLSTFSPFIYLHFLSQSSILEKEVQVFCKVIVSFVLLVWV